METSARRTSTLVAVLFLVVSLAPRTQTQGRPAFQNAWAAGTPIEVAGHVSVIYADDPASGRSDIRYEVTDERTGRTYRIRFERQPLNVPRSGSRVTLRGRARDSEVYLAAGGSESSWSVETVASVSPATLSPGEQKTLVIVANFSDATVQPLFPGADCSVPAIGERVFGASGSVDALYREMSGSKLSFAGTVAGPFTLSVSRDSACNPSAWANEADNLAKAAGMDPADYTRKVYVMPWGGWCGAAGLGEFGSTPSRTWVFNCDRTDLYAHELGHNLGLHHAATPDSEYGDLSDLMGDSGPMRPFNGPHKFQMGWLPTERTLTVTQEGVHEVAGLSVDSADSRTRLLRVPGAQSGFYVSYRHSTTGFEGNLYGDYKDRTSVHRWAGETSKTYLVALLRDGESFTDSASGFSVSQISHTTDSALVSVKPGNTCAAAAPALSISPSEQSAPAGATTSYTISVTNSDSSSCAASSFALAASVPQGWTGTVSPQAVSLAPGASGQAVLSVASAAGALPGSYGVTVASNTSGIPVHAASATATQTVVAGCEAAPTVVLSPSSQSAAPGATRQYSVGVTNNDPYGCSARTFSLTAVVPAGWTGVLSPSTISVAAGITANATYAVTASSAALAGDYAIKVQTVTTAGTSTGTGTFGVVTTGDAQPPSAPKNLSGSYKRRQVQLGWQAASDNIGIAGYFVWRNGTLLGATTSLSWRDAPETSTGELPYEVAAYDAAGNLSPRAAVVIRVSAGRGK